MERQKRTSLPPKKFEPVLGTASEQKRTRKIYRLLRKADIKSDLIGRSVHILWPDNGRWYEALVKKLLVRSRKARLYYPETEEVEDIDLKELIVEKSVAVGKMGEAAPLLATPPPPWPRFAQEVSFPSNCKLYIFWYPSPSPASLITLASRQGEGCQAAAHVPSHLLPGLLIPLLTTRSLPLVCSGESQRQRQA